MFLFIFYSMEEIWLGILNAPFISLEIHRAVQFYFFFFFFFPVLLKGRERGRN
jgi:hypothetical protein